MNAEFNWWLLIVGLVLGAALTWLVMSESVRRDVDITDTEQRGEARWIARILSAAGRAIAAERIEEILRLHREYLAAPPPDEPIAPEPAPERAPVAAWDAARGSGPGDSPDVHRDPAEPEPAVGHLDEAD